VKHDGKVYPCCDISEPHGDLTVQTFEGISCSSIVFSPALNVFKSFTLWMLGVV